MRRILAFLPFLLATAGCSLLVGNEIDGNGESRVTSCTDQPDGTACVGADHCLNQECRRNTCGDGVMLAAAGEQCDDGNTTPGDGCQPTCQFTCSAVVACPDDDNACNGTPVCDVASHTCSAGTAAPNGQTCTPSGGVPESGSCADGFCVSASCGDGVVTTGEDCEPSVDGAGCRPDCTWVCVVDGQCPTDDPCTSVRSCNLTTHTCIDVGPANCNDGDPCTIDSCDVTQGGCVSEFEDRDDDGFAPRSLGTCADPTVGGDCEDRDPARKPGAPEQCNGVDDDCDDQTDEGVVPIACATDGDGDGYGDPSSVVSICLCPQGTVPLANGSDCNDRNPDVRPGLVEWLFFSVGYCPDGSLAEPGGRFCKDNSLVSFDYNCDGVQQEEIRTRAWEACTLAGGCDGGGWDDAIIPGCGQSAGFTDCYFGVFGACQEAQSYPRVQSCR